MKRMSQVILLLLALLFNPSVSQLFAGEITLWFPPAWKDNAAQAKAISDALSQGSGESISPRIAKDYPEILNAFIAKQPALVYVGSFVQAMLKARDLGIPVAQCVDGKELYGGIMVFPKGQDPSAILKESPAEIAFAVATSSGESAAKAATEGKAAFKTPSHKAAAGAVKAGKAKAAFVKTWWWEDNKGEFAEFDAFSVPGISDAKNPDNVLSTSTAIPPEVQRKIQEAAPGAKDAFKAPKIVPFDAANLDFSIALMKKGGIDPLNYAW
jgi:ABC-type phosphate/phosphonate transport system substrate-binding protein